MGRTTVYNNITSPELIAKINPTNIYLKKEFLEYLESIDRAKTTIAQYASDLDIFFCWNVENNDNKDFIKISKREFAKFQNHTLNEWKWSPKRIRRVKSTISSLSNFIENIMDEEEGYENYRSVIRKIDNPVDAPIREKTVFKLEELQSLLDHLVEQKKYKQAAVVALAMFSGRRKAEIPRFKVSYFDDANVIFGSLWKTPEKVTTKGRGSNGKQIHLYVLRNQFKPYFDLWMKQREEEHIESEWLFPAIDDIEKPMRTETMDGWKDAYTRFLGKEFYWHALRHFFTTFLSESGIPTNVIQDIVNWETADMVNLYVDTSADENIGKYFDENGIKQVDKKTLSDL